MKIYLSYFISNIKILNQFRSDFIIGLGTIAAEQLINILFIQIIYLNINGIGNYNQYEILLMYGFLATGRALQLTYLDNIWNIGYSYIKMGDLDRILIKPKPALFQILAEKINFQGIFAQIFGLVIILYSLQQLNYQLTIKALLVVILFSVSSMIILGAISLIFATTSFWLSDATYLVSSVFSFSELARYPLPIFNVVIQISLTFIIPFAFASYYPASYFLTSNYTMMSLLTPLVAVVLLVIALVFWTIGLQKYTGVA